MTKRLNEELVFRKTKLNNLADIKKLNCWGNEIEDVSLLQQMPHVQVLSLSINKINTLATFQYCTSLQELYVRKNDIKDLNEICYLQGLKNLRNLWLAENPCSLHEDYRPTVIRTLTQLKQLDNLPITETEYKEAAIRGRLLIHPDNLPRMAYGEDSPEKEEKDAPKGNEFYMSINMNFDNSCNQNTPNYNNQNKEETMFTKMKTINTNRSFEDNMSHSNSCNQNSLNYHNQIKEDSNFTKMKNCSFEDSSSVKTYRQSSPPTYRMDNNYENEECYNTIRCSFEDQNDYNTITSLPNIHLNNEIENDNFSVKDDHYMDDSYTCRPRNAFHQPIIQPLSEISFSYEPPMNHSGSSNDLDDSLESSHLQKSNSNGLKGEENANSFNPVSRRGDSNNSITQGSYQNRNSNMVSEDRRENIREKCARKRISKRKNTTKTANVLSAVLCLLKELDFSSLEVVEMVVASRLDELEGICLN